MAKKYLTVSTVTATPVKNKIGKDGYWVVVTGETNGRWVPKLEFDLGYKEVEEIGFAGDESILMIKTGWSKNKENEICLNVWRENSVFTDLD
jgi:hypothetical protein